MSDNSSGTNSQVERRLMGYADEFLYDNPEGDLMNSQGLRRILADLVFFFFYLCY